MIKNCKYFVKYNTLKLKSRARERELEKHINELIQQLAEVRADVEYAKVKEKLAKKQLSQLRTSIREKNKKCKISFFIKNVLTKFKTFYRMVL